MPLARRGYPSLIAVERCGNLLRQVEPGGVFALQGDEIAGKAQIITDQHAQAHSQLQGHGFVIGRPQAKGSGVFTRVVPVEIQGAKEHGALFLDGILFTAHP